MDDRQRQVEAGAGLQESRLNEDFIDLLKKYGTTVLLILLAIMATYVGIQRYSQYQQDMTDQAFADLDNAANTPAILLDVASSWDGRGSVWEIATLRAAKVYLDSARTRTEVGVNPAEVAESEILSDERVRTNLQEAVKLFTSVLDRAAGSKPIFAQDSRWGIASANLGLAALAEGESRVQFLDAAADATRQMVEAAEGIDTNKVAVGNARLELIEILRAKPVSVYETASLPEEARFQPDPRENTSNLTRDEMTPSAGPSTPEGGLNMQPIDPELRRRIEEQLQGLNSDDPALSIDPADVPPSNPASDDPQSEDPQVDDPASDDPAQPGQ